MADENNTENRRYCGSFDNEGYLFGKLAKANNTMIIPGNLTDISGMIASAIATLKLSQGEGHLAETREVRFEKA